MANTVIGLEYFQGFVYNDTNWDWTTYKGQQTVEYVDTLNAGDAAALGMDLSGFNANGGKLIMYHGLSDTTIPTGSSIEYYQGVNSTMKLTTESLQDFFKLYIIPGMGHCGESEVVRKVFKSLTIQYINIFRLHTSLPPPAKSLIPLKVIALVSLDTRTLNMTFSSP